ncbi:MAG: hypothetical protein HC767_05010 [Akkermansiaceae bacterium]|nr:hypothetical protein [Akkermansiaceae bacterium]
MVVGIPGYFVEVAGRTCHTTCLLSPDGLLFRLTSGWCGVNYLIYEKTLICSYFYTFNFNRDVCSK